MRVMTKEQASHTWCPEYRVAGIAAGNEHGQPISEWEDNRGSFPTQTEDYARRGMCIGPACQLWEEAEAPREMMRLYLSETERDGEPIVRAGSVRVVAGERWSYEYTDCDERGEFEALSRAAPEGAEKLGYCGLRMG